LQSDEFEFKQVLSQVDKALNWLNPDQCMFPRPG